MTAAHDHVSITHPEKVLFPDDGITKAEVAAYYAAVATVMLPHVRRRPVTMERFPSGIGTKGFLQKNVVKGFPEWLERAELPKKDGTVHYPLANDAKLAPVDGQPEHGHAARVDVADARRAAARRLRVRSRSGAGRSRAAADRGARRSATCSTNAGCRPR